MYSHEAALAKLLTSNPTQHVTWWRELQGSFANQSNMTTSGKSFEGRDIFGLHLWGAGGPGKPAVLYHGTVHAREWIGAPYVSFT
jgi:hypothetical protein